MDDGYIVLARKFFEHAYWTEERRFSKAEAWVDLIAMAAFKARERIVGHTRVRLERGEVLASIRYLADRWSWDKETVGLFLAATADAEETQVKSRTPVGTVYRLVNYDTYQFLPTEESGQETDSTQTGDRQRRSKGSKGKKEEYVFAGSRLACDEWQKRIGKPPGGRIGSALKPLAKEHGNDEVLWTWAYYLANENVKYVSPESFAGKYLFWRDKSQKNKNGTLPRLGGY